MYRRTRLPVSNGIEYCSRSPSKFGSPLLFHLTDDCQLKKVLIENKISFENTNDFLYPMGKKFLSRGKVIIPMTKKSLKSDDRTSSRNRVIKSLHLMALHTPTRVQTCGDQRGLHFPNRHPCRRCSRGGLGLRWSHLP